MARYIDSEEAEELLEICGEYSASQLVASVDTADVVPVIRCKDCRYGSVRGGEEPSVTCTRSIGKHYPQRSFDYCSHARAKGGSE